MCPQGGEERDHLSRCSARCVNEDVGNRRSPAWDEDLVELIEACIARHQNDREQRPFQVGFGPARADAAQQKPAQDEIFRQVAAFADVVVKGLQRGEGGRAAAASEEPEG
jgi:hypothetical protein